MEGKKKKISKQESKGENKREGQRLVGRVGSRKRRGGIRFTTEAAMRRFVLVGLQTPINSFTPQLNCSITEATEERQRERET